MPTIDVAMARSLRGGVWGSIRSGLARSVTANLVRRGIIDDAQGKADDVATAFSSWDNCMNAAYCKWPVIGIMVIGGLIIFSIIWCIIRCCCCGVSCCCGCCQCLKCCGDCCGCCDPPGTRNKHKHLDDPYPPQPNHGYRSEAPMDPSISPFAPRANHGGFNHDNNHHTGVTQPGVPQFAEFETSKRGAGEDSLPEMPSWENAATKKVMVHEEEVEMKNLRKSPAPEQQVGAMNNNIPSNRSSPSPLPQGRNPYDRPSSPYGQPPSPYGQPPSPYGQPPSSQNPYLGTTNQQPDHYSPIDHNYGYNSNTNVNGYGANTSYLNNTPGGAVGGTHTTSDRDAPVELQGSDSYVPAANTSTSNQTTYYEAPGDLGVYPQSRTPANDNSNYDNYRRATPGPMYGTDPHARQSPAPGARHTPAPNQDPYGYGQSARHTPAPANDYAYNQARRTPGPANDFGFDRAFSPAPDRQYGAASPRPLARPVPHRVYDNEPQHSSINNNSGFDFNSGHTRPDQSPTTTSYPGYKAYSPS